MDVLSPRGTRTLWTALGVGLGIAVMLWCAEVLVGGFGGTMPSVSGSAAGSVLMPAAPSVRASLTSSGSQPPARRIGAAPAAPLVERHLTHHRHVAVRTRRPVVARRRSAPRAAATRAPATATAASTRAVVPAPAPVPAPPATIDHGRPANIGTPPGQAKKANRARDVAAPRGPETGPAEPAAPSSAPGRVKAPGPPAVPPGQSKKGDPSLDARARAKS